MLPRCKLVGDSIYDIDKIFFFLSSMIHFKYKVLSKIGSELNLCYASYGFLGYVTREEA